MEKQIINIDIKSNYYTHLLKLIKKLYSSEMTEDMKSNNNYFFGYILKEELIGFIHLSIRYEYVNGSESSPVGYIEGIYIEREYRRLGYARELVNFAFAFFKKKNLLEVISDSKIDNEEGIRFHKALGFEEAEQIIFFKSKLK